MDLIIWRENFNTGVSRVDNQHKYLVDLINKLFNAIGKVDKDEDVKKIFLELHSYTINHFSMEEAMMKEFNYKDSAKHKHEHVEFVNTINEFKSKFVNGEAKVSVDLLNFLKDWLLKHIIGTDKRTFAVIGR